MNAVASALEQLAQALNEALPQTQCTRCGYPDCRAYSEAIAHEGAAINQCPPGGAEGIERLALLTDRPVLPLNPVNGAERPRQLAVIDEAWCIGCTLCLKVCPVDSILGGPKAMHTVIDAECTGCELCLPVCPVDCISLVPASGQRTGWQAWSPAQASTARERHEQHRTRISRDDARHAQAEIVPPRGKQSVIEAALARARATRNA
jgi:Na+-translocating ferredoxin:NAD+ oxidoreductase subunit B